MGNERVLEGKGCREKMKFQGGPFLGVLPTLIHVILTLGSFSSIMQSKTTVVSTLVSLSSRGFRIWMV